MTNPNNAIGTNGAYSGRTSPNALNDIAGAFTRGIISGWSCAPDSGMTVALGGIAGTRDVAVAVDNAGNRETINNRSGAPVTVTLSAAHTSYNRIDLIVAYVDANPTGDGTTTDNPAACGIIPVAGTPASTPTAPDDAAIRSAITTDGGTGTSAYYVILATITVGANVATIGSAAITQGAPASTITTNAVTTGVGTLNTTYLSGAAFWFKVGKLVVVTWKGAITTAMPSQASVDAITNLPKASSAYTFSQSFTGADYSAPTKEFIIQMPSGSTKAVFQWPPNNTAREVVTQIVYFTD